MSEQSKSRLYRVEDLPLFVHEPVLGVDIGVKQRATHTHQYITGRGREATVDVNAYGSDTYSTAPYQRRYIAAWARRNLFGGAP